MEDHTSGPSTVVKDDATGWLSGSSSVQLGSFVSFLGLSPFFLVSKAEFLVIEPVDQVTLFTWTSLPARMGKVETKKSSIGEEETALSERLGERYWR